LLINRLLFVTQCKFEFEAIEKALFELVLRHNKSPQNPFQNQTVVDWNPTKNHSDSQHSSSAEYFFLCLVHPATAQRNSEHLDPSAGLPRLRCHPPLGLLLPA
jgi:hypothetical protein